jgi:hypothetical protein
VTASTARARDTPGRAPIPQQIDGLLVIDTENGRARYDCFRPDCPQPREGPVVYRAAIPGFIAAVKSEHLARHHQGETR